MILVTAATEIEMNALLDQLQGSALSFLHLVTGVGLAQTAQRLTQFLCENSIPIEGVVNFGVGGGFFSPANKASEPRVLDICVADREVFGDLGICMEDSVDYLPEELVGPVTFDIKNPLYHRCVAILRDAEIEHRNGVFITVNSVSGRKARGQYLQSRWDGLCENMEGAAVAQVCSMFSLDLFELRTISNMVEDRDPSAWKIKEACLKAADTTRKILETLN